MPLMWILVLLLSTVPLQAANGQVISDKDSFLSTLNGRAVTMPLFDLTLNVLPDGSVTGTAMGWGVSGNWVWKDGLFCREMDWSGYKIDYDCQLVEKVGEKLRFTAKAGEGRAADFRLQ